MALLELLDGAECTTDEVLRRLHLPAEKKRSVQRDLVELQRRNLITLTDRKRYTRVRPVSALNAAQALALYTAARMLAHLNLQDNKHYLNILEKLTAVLPERARQVASLMNSTSGPHERQPQARTFEIAARAWLEGRVLRSMYAGSQRGSASSVELAIYFVEVNPRNHEVYAIGVNELKPSGGIRVYRLTRMQTPTLSDRTYDIPPEFNPSEYMSNAWGIMSGTPKQVELHFSPEVAHRVQEVQFPSFHPCSNPC